MSLTKNQTSRYWREWSAVCRKQGWKTNDDDKRYAFHQKAECPQSMKDFDNAAFDKFLQVAALHQNQVDIRDRARERVEVAVRRLAAAIGEIEGKDPETYIRGIVRDMNDRESWLDLPHDPRDEQIERGVKKVTPDIENLRDTLKNRLSTLLTAIKQGATCPPGKDWYLVCANNPIIWAILCDKVCYPIGPRGKYGYCTPAEWAAQKAREAAARRVVQKPAYNLDATPVAPRERKGRQAMRAPIAEFQPEPLPGHEQDPEYVPF